MPPRLSLRSVTNRSHSLRSVVASPTPSVCFFCSLSTPSIPSRTRRPKSLATRRHQSTVTSAATSTNTSSSRTSDTARAELLAALQDLQKHAANYVNLSRVQLALNALREDAGDETVRVAILGLTDGLDSGNTAKEILRLLLADPLSPEQEWEKQLIGHDTSLPLIVRIGTEGHSEGATGGKEGSLTYAKGGLLKEINVSSPGLNGHKLELLLMESNPLVDSAQGALQNFEETALVPTVEIPTSSTGRYTPVTTPVHKTLLITNGIRGATSVIDLPLMLHEETVSAAVDLSGYAPEDGPSLPFIAVDTKKASEGLVAFRQSLGRAFEYEKLWFKSNLPTLVSWLKAGVTSTENDTTKGAVRSLIASVLQNTLAAIQEEEARRLSSGLSSHTSPVGIASLNKELAEWSEKAHAELQGELDRAFTSRRWNKLNWWKLFWRVDDVGILSSEMLSQRFLPRAERNVIYLAGQIEGSGLFGPKNGRAVYSLPALLPAPESRVQAVEPVSAQPTQSQASQGTKWPTHITFTRNYLQSKTVPALQALAQKLILQSASFSTLTTGLGALMYLSSFGISESGAVAAFGIVWSLRRLQKKWESAREYWQSEVREEGRKAVRAVELSVGEALDKAVTGSSSPDNGSLHEEFKNARELVQRAEDAFKKLK